jgi:hypothetical protein
MLLIGGALSDRGAGERRARGGRAAPVIGVKTDG